MIVARHRDSRSIRSIGAQTPRRARSLYAAGGNDFKGGCERKAQRDNRRPTEMPDVHMREQDDHTTRAAEQVWQVVVSIPRGSVATYGQVASLAGLPGGARRVGRILSQLPDGTRIPWHRVVNASGGISLPPGSGSYRKQRSRLRSEGIAFSKTGRISLSRYGWRP
jgi:methylated-DNA-protein-cysteine methyltransferase-like protein